MIVYYHALENDWCVHLDLDDDKACQEYDPVSEK